MRLIFFITIYLLVSQSTYCQDNTEKKTTIFVDTVRTMSFEPMYFVLGTLSDYMGRFQYIDRNKQVDKYYPYEKPLVDRLTKYINSELNIVVDTVFRKSKHSEMFSDELSKTLNSFYGEKDELINNKFETNKQIYSFLAGVYYRYGEKLDTNVYKVQLANSPKHQNCYEFLKRIGCTNIFYKYLRNIPAQFILYFEPTEELKKYLYLIESDRVILRESFFAQIEGMMRGHMTKEEMALDFSKSKDKETEKIKKAFER